MEPVTLDWRDRARGSAAPRPCRHCAKPTNLRTPKTGQAAHKTCEEASDQAEEVVSQ